MTKASDNVFPRFLVSEGGSTATPAAGQVTFYAKADGLLYSKDDAGTEKLMSGVPAGGGVTQTVLGYNTIGGTAGAATAHRIYAKRITATAGTIVSIGAYIKQNTAATQTTVAVGLLTDNAGDPQYVIAAGVGYIFGQVTTGVAGTARWVDVPLGAAVTATNYWICFQLSVATYSVHNDGSGTDRHWTASSTPQIADYGTIYTPTTTTNKYSLRALHIA